MVCESFAIQFKLINLWIFGNTAIEVEVKVKSMKDAIFKKSLKKLNTKSKEITIIRKGILPKLLGEETINQDQDIITKI